jgi:cytidylate kinase
MPIIAISRGSLSGGALLAKSLGAKLGLKVISREVIIEAAQEYAVSEADLIKGLENPPGLWERLVGTKRERYLLAIQSTLADMIEDGHVVYHGIAGQMLLKDLPNVLKVRLIAPVEYRVRAAMVEHHWTREEAKKHIAAADMLRAQWVRRLYQLEWTDPSLYDVVLNLSHMSIETAADLVVKLSESEEFQPSEDHAQAVRDFALRTRVDAALAFRSPFPDAHVEVQANRGTVNLSGTGIRDHRDSISNSLRGSQVSKRSTRIGTSRRTAPVVAKPRPM